jgi:hypothetical protein
MFNMSLNTDSRSLWQSDGKKTRGGGDVERKAIILK